MPNEARKFIPNSGCKKINQLSTIRERLNKIENMVNTYGIDHMCEYVTNGKHNVNICMRPGTSTILRLCETHETTLLNWCFNQGIEIPIEVVNAYLISPLYMKEFEKMFDKFLDSKAGNSRISGNLTNRKYKDSYDGSDDSEDSNDEFEVKSSPRELNTNSIDLTNIPNTPPNKRRKRNIIESDTE